MHSNSAYSLMLASASPRRSELLSSVGLHFTVEVADIEEKRNSSESASLYVQRLASEKAAAVRDRQEAALTDSLVILAADTIVVNGAGGNDVLEKPICYEDAVRMWSSLSESSHQVMTAVCINAIDPGLGLEGGIKPQTVVVCSDVTMGKISLAAMQRYWDSGEPQDKAGAYALQGLASAWVRTITGSPSNIVGLPLFETNHLLKPYGLNWL